MAFSHSLFSLGMNDIEIGSFGGIFVFLEQKSGQNELITSSLYFDGAAEW